MSGTIYAFKDIQAAFPSAPSTSHTASPATLSSLPGTRPTVFDGVPDLPDMNAAAQSEDRWVERLTPAAMNEMVRDIFALPGIAALTDEHRDVWLRLLFGAADAERLGATEARQIALEWSRPGKAFNEEDFNRAWVSFKVGRA